MILLIDNYDSFTYNLYQLVQAQTSLPVQVYRNDALERDALLALAPQKIILSPGPGHPKNERDFGICRDILQLDQFKQTPLLGVCLGHQGMALVAGGQVVQAPVIMHGKTSMVSVVAEHPIFKNIQHPFQAMRYHSLVVDATTLPSCYQPLAYDNDHQLLMAMAHRYQPWVGLQFHPESIGTPTGTTMLKNWLELAP